MAKLAFFSMFPVYSGLVQKTLKTLAQSMYINNFRLYISVCFSLSYVTANVSHSSVSEREH